MCETGGSAETYQDSKGQQKQQQKDVFHQSPRHTFSCGDSVFKSFSPPHFLLAGHLFRYFGITRKYRLLQLKWLSQHPHAVPDFCPPGWGSPSLPGQAGVGVSQLWPVCPGLCWRCCALWPPPGGGETEAHPPESCSADAWPQHCNGWAAQGKGSLRLDTLSGRGGQGPAWGMLREERFYPSLNLLLTLPLNFHAMTWCLGPKRTLSRVLLGSSKACPFLLSSLYFLLLTHKR